jgi:hypothetical protein
VLPRRAWGILPFVSVLAVSIDARAADLPSDWKDAEAYELSLSAETARASALYDVCIEKDRASIDREDHPTTRVHLAGCAEKAGKILVALREMRVVLDAALEEKDVEVAELAQKRVEQLLRKLATVTVVPPRGASDLVINVDDATLAEASYDKPLRLDPGTHRFHAEGILEGTPMTFDEVHTLASGDQENVVVALRPKPSEFLTPGQLACMQAARTQDEVLRCLPGAAKPLVVRAALEASGYSDNLPTKVFSPQVRGSIASPTSGWHASASYLVDVVSTASPDFVSTASPRGRDTRHAAAIGGGYKPGRFGVDIGGALSSEADYVSRSGSAAVVGDFADKRVTPRIGYAYTHDTIGRGGTSYDVYANTLVAHEITASASIVLGPKTLLVAGGTLGIERGDQSKPYRLIPMFARGAQIPRGASADVVNAQRLPVRPYEQLPLERDRYAIGLRFAHRFSGSTFRAEQRVYRDSWEVLASTTDVRFLVDIGAHVLVGPHARLHLQEGASFYHRVYIAETSPRLVVPTFRTTDRELGPMRSYTGGASAWWTLNEGSSPTIVLYASGDVLYSSYMSSLYVTSRLGAYGTIGIEAVFE